MPNAIALPATGLRPQRRPRYYVVVVGTALALTVLGAIVAALWSARVQEIAAWKLQLSNLSLVLAEQTSQELSAAYLILDSLAGEVQQARISDAAGLRAAMGTAEVHHALRNKIAALPQIDVATIVAADGQVLNFTRAFPTPAIDLRERDYFKERRDNPRTGVFISAPVRNKGNGQWTFYLSKRLNDPQGRFLGMVLVGLSSTFLSNFYQKISLGDGASIALYRRDFTLLASWPHQDALMGKVNRSGTSYQVIEVAQQTQGVMLSAAPRFSAHGAPVSRMGAARVLDQYPLIVNVTVTERLFLSQWRQFSLALLVVALASMLAIGSAFRALYRSMARRDQDLLLMEQLKTEAEAASHAKSEFLAMMSHEIRTPLTAIIGFAETLDSASAREASDVILRNGHHLLSIINDILDISKIEAGRLHLENLPFSPLETALGLATVMQAQAAAKGIVFRTDVAYPFPEQVMGDPTRWRQVLFNLCSNAVKFTERGSVQLTLGYDGTRQRLLCSVHDTGIGMSEDQRAGLFAPFAQGDGAVARKYGGTGLGLHLVRRLARKMGGEVQVASSVGKGSLFSVDVQAAPAMPVRWLNAAPAPAPAPRAPGARPLRGRVLLAEDGHDNRTLICAMLRARGLEVLVAEDGARAVELALAEHVDLILMDIQMPVMDGMQATAVLRASGFGAPVVALTANVMAEDVRRYLDSGFSHCVGKPIVRAALDTVLGQLLGTTAPACPTLADLPDYAQLCAQFAATWPRQLAALAAHGAAGQWPALAALAHQIKGSAGSFGHAEAGRLADAIERAVRRDDRDEAARALAALLALEGVEVAA
jgi:signal transduction histidine kinase/HPt (histidine-containing phosphotransfer) domain-containing protein